MPIGLVDDTQFEKELSNSRRVFENRVSSISPPKVEVLDRPGRDKGDNNVPDSLRALIGEEAVINGRSAALDLASRFGVSPSSVSAYAKGSTSTASYDSPTKSIISHINKSRERAVKKASRTLNSALSAITQEKLDYTDARDLSGIAKDMSVIIKNLEPPAAPQQGGDSHAPQFVIYAPQFKDERSFEVINVNE